MFMCLRGFEVKEGILCASSAGTDSGIELLPPTREPITQERHQVAAALKRKEEKRAHRGTFRGGSNICFFTPGLRPTQQKGRTRWF